MRIKICLAPLNGMNVLNNVVQRMMVAKRGLFLKRRDLLDELFIGGLHFVVFQTIEHDTN